MAIVSQLFFSFPYVLHGLCEDYLTCDIAFNAVMPLSRASTRGRYSCIEGVTDNDFVTDTDANDKDNSAPTYRFMARGAKVNSRTTHYQTSSEHDSDCGSKPSYKTLAKITTEQQKAMEHIQKLLDKSDDLLDAEMTRS